MIPLLINALPKTFGLMLLGVATWRAEILKRPARHRWFLAIVFFGATFVGAIATSLIFWSAITGKALPVAPVVVEALSYVPLGLGLASGSALWLSYPRTGWLIDLFSAAGRMALTNYLIQSIIWRSSTYGSWQRMRRIA